MIAFLAKTWFLWWAFGIVVGLRWFHLLSARGPGNPSDAPSVEEEKEQVSSRIFQKAYAISLPEMRQAF